METLTNYIYLLQEREFVNINSNIFKVGMTTKLNHERFNQYPKGSKLLFKIICNDCKNIEKIILKKFKEKFNHQLAIGNEYFEGDYKIMIDDIYSIVKNNNEEKTLKLKQLEDELKQQLEDELKQQYIEKEIYYLNPVPSDPKCMYITSRLINQEVERGHLQYQIIPELLIKLSITNEELLDFIIEEITEDNLKRLLPLTKTAGDINDYKLLLVIKSKRDNNLICLKGALLNKKTNRIALMTSFNDKNHIERSIKSHDSNYFIGHYRLSAPPKFWSELIKIVKQEVNILKIKYKLRNNQWRKHTNVLDSIIYTKK